MSVLGRQRRHVTASMPCTLWRTVQLFALGLRLENPDRHPRLAGRLLGNKEIPAIIEHEGWRCPFVPA